MLTEDMQLVYWCIVDLQCLLVSDTQQSDSVVYISLHIYIHIYDIDYRFFI